MDLVSVIYTETLVSAIGGVRNFHDAIIVNSVYYVVGGSSFFDFSDITTVGIDS